MSCSPPASGFLSSHPSPPPAPSYPPILPSSRPPLLPPILPSLLYPSCIFCSLSRQPNRHRDILLTHAHRRGLATSSADNDVTSTTSSYSSVLDDGAKTHSYLFASIFSASIFSHIGGKQVSIPFSLSSLSSRPSPHPHPRPPYPPVLRLLRLCPALLWKVLWSGGFLCTATATE